ncbi:S16 family serine protease [Haloarculaceae archaeon H-GB11]|nr:S16 family serine protease [Haloarculaceae archaeon H-GB11]
MAPDSATDVDEKRSSRPEDSSLVEELERKIVNRREFLKGVGVGGATAGGVGIGTARLSERVSFQSLATLAGGEVVPSKTTYYLPAVDGSERGLILTVDIEFTDAREGIFVNLAGMEVRHDLQVALREAVTTARELRGRRPSKSGILVSFTATGDGILALRGKSWEAGLTVVLAAALSEVTPGTETLVTGVVADDGKLLPVGSIESKARAARAFGARQLLVPDGQEQQVSGITVEGVASIEQAVDIVLNEQ